MTANEARQVLKLYAQDAKRRDIIGKCARGEIKQAYIVLAYQALELNRRSRSPRVKRAWLEIAGFYRTAAANQEPTL